MRKLSFISVVLIFGFIAASAQPCLPEGITFSTQAQIDSFQIIYPNCTEIEGDVLIYGDDITNLNGLNVLTSIGGRFGIGEALYNGNPNLTNLTGLDCLTSINDNFKICNNDALTSLTGLENLSSIGGDLYIGDYFRNTIQMSHIDCFGNPNLTNLSGLSNLNTIGGDLIVYCNDLLADLSGLTNLDSIGGGLYIGHAEDNNPDYRAGNQSLTSLSGLETVSFIGGVIQIQGNFSLESLAGIENIDVSSMDNIKISYNDSLSVCEIQGICEYLAAPNGEVSIHHNAPGCNNPPEVANACGFAIPCLPYGNYYFYSQSDIDDFPVNYPGCADLEGLVLINGEDITNLNGLSEVTSFGGNLTIAGNDTLTNLIGLNNLTSIEGDLTIGFYTIGFWVVYGNKNLISLSGLDNLTSINGDFEFWSNEHLTDLSGIDGLTTIGGDLVIRGNGELTDLTGMGNLSSIGRDMFISYNSSLSTCEVQSVCDYIASPNGTIEIHDNATGCDSQQEVENACDTLSIYEFNFNAELSVAPNPFTTSTTLSYTLSKPENVQFTVYNVQSQIVFTMQEKQDQGEQKVQWNAEGLTAGMYYFRIQAGEQVGVGKIIKISDI